MLKAIVADNTVIPLSRRCHLSATNRRNPPGRLSPKALVVHCLSLTVELRMTPQEQRLETRPPY
jgi:hypothetical protein